MMGGMRISGGDVKALACQSGFGLGFGAIAVGLIGLVELSDWVAFIACMVWCLVGVCVGVSVADRRGWL
jgi:hypothetical protein